MKMSILFSLLLFKTYCFAQTGIENPIQCPYMYIGQPSSINLQYLPLIDLKVNAHISNSIAHVELTQVFTNPNQRPIEAVYVFPGSSGAAIYGLSMQINERTIVAKIDEKAAASIQYQEAKSAGQRASLLEQQRPNVYQMKVANIMPMDTIKVTISYSEYVKSEAGTYRFVLPATIGPRYAGENTKKEAMPIEANYLPGYISSSHPLNIDLTLSTGVPIQHVSSNSHKIDVEAFDPTRYRVGLNPTERFSANKDFTLEYKLRGDYIQSGILQHTGADENFFSLQIQPPKQVQIEAVPNREYLFVIDVSGSMNGFPLETAKILLQKLLAELRPSDLFNIVLFDFSSKQLFDTSVPASRSNLSKALRFVHTRGGGFGGTNLYNTLKKVYQNEDIPDRSRSTIIITDGHIEAEKKVFKLIRDHLHISNVFALGIGSSVNHYLIEGIAYAGLGEKFVITDPAFAEETASKLISYINRPALTNISIDFGNNKVYDVSPTRLPDLLADRPLMIYGKFFESLTDEITIYGQSGSEHFVQRITTTQDSLYNPALEHLWARSKVKELMDFEDPTKENIQEVKQIGLTYSLLTDYTSFVAVDSELANFNQNLSTTINQPIPVPADYHPTGFPSYASTGAVVRSVGYSDIEIMLPSQSSISGPLLLIKWQSESNEPYTITIKDIHDKVIYETTTSEDFLWLNTSELALETNSLILLKITSGKLRSDEVGMKYMNVNPEYHQLFDFHYKYPIAEYFMAIDDYLKQHCTVDAITLLEIALINYPNDQGLLKKRDEFLFGNVGR